MKLKTNKTLTKGKRKKIKINKGRIGKNNIWKIIIEGLNWNKNKIFRKGLRRKIKNQKNNEWNWNTKNKEGNTFTFSSRREKIRKKKGPPVTNYPSSVVMSNNRRKRIQWRFQWRSGRACLTIGKSCTCRLNDTIITRSLAHNEHTPTYFLIKK
jgi:hypothetical protein